MTPMSMRTQLSMNVGSHEVVLNDDLSKVNGSSEYECTKCGLQASDQNTMRRFNCE